MRHYRFDYSHPLFNLWGNINQQYIGFQADGRCHCCIAQPDLAYNFDVCLLL